ncbi:MAG TPA: hypothetical protein VF168_10670 [Trueperaceae bacterium]
MRTLPTDEFGARWPLAAPFVLVAALAVVAAGLVSAASAFAPSYEASWSVAYLTLVVGFSQLVLGLGQAFLQVRPPDARTVRIEIGSYNLGNACVLAGSLLDLPVFTVVGAVLLAGTLYMFYNGTRGATTSGWPIILYRSVTAILALSIPVGLVIAAFG